MIFGFNTDISHEDIVYHVQSEASEGEQLLQTQVFVRGRCIGKRVVSYTAAAAAANTAGESFPQQGVDQQSLGDHGLDQQTLDQQKEKRLRDQHREVLDAIREGRIESVLDTFDATAVQSPAKQLDLEWINADSVHSEGTLQMKLLVTEAGVPLPGARLTLRLARSGVTPYYAQILTDATGHGEMSLRIDEATLPDASVLVQANFGGRTVTRKFQLRHIS